MIHIILRYGAGDRPAPAISDALIPDEATAYIRAQQELADTNYIKFERTLSMPHDPEQVACGVFTDEFAYQKLGIYGGHLVTSRTIALTPTSATESVTLQQYRELGQ